MAVTPFQRLDPIRPTLVQRLLGRRPAGNALVELVDMLRGSASLLEVTISTVDEIGEEYEVDVRRDFQHDLQRLYRQYMLFCLTDRRLSRDELAELEHLRVIFGLDATTCEAIQRNVTREVYMKSVEEILADGAVDESERAFLAQLQEHLSIPPAIADNILDIKQRQYRSRRNRRDRD